MRIVRDWRTARAWVSVGAMAVMLWASGSGSSRAQSAVAPAPASAAVASTSCNLTTTERIVAVGDVHGAFDKFVTILEEAKLIDSRQRWTGERATLVQTGDITDRGPDSLKVIDLLRKLTDEAAKAGGRVHALLGNHEAMRVLRVYQDVSPGEYAAFRTPESSQLRDRYFTALVEDYVKRAKAAGTEFDSVAFRKQFYEATPIGSVEMQLAFGAKADYGRWLRDRDAMVKINGIVFMHGGPSAAVAPMGCAAINAQVRTEMATLTVGSPNFEKSLSMGDDGPLWYRGLVKGPGVSEQELETILKALDARAIVLGHTVPDGFRIKPTFGGRVVQIDTGMLDGKFFPGGVPSALEIHGDTWTAIYQGRREPLSGPPQ